MNACDGLPARDLQPAELCSLLAGVSAELTERDRGAAQPSAGERSYRSLFRNEHVDVWLISWGAGGDTGWHDHDTSSGAVQVLSGGLLESRPSLAGAPLERAVPAGRQVSFGPDHIHRLIGADGGALSVHAYSPPLWRMGQYATDPDGSLRRRSVSYAEELRPIA